METNKIFTEARARITWGDSAVSVRDYLIQNGIPKTEADAKVQAFNAERSAEIRKISIKNALVGIFMLTASSFLLYLDTKYYQGPHAFITSGDGSELGFFGLGIFYGLWKLLNGIISLIRPQSEEGSISDMLE